MLHAVIRNHTQSLYFLGELDAYSLETLEQHARRMAKAGQAVRLDIEMDPAEQRAFAFSGREWIARLRDAGVSLRIVPRHLGGRFARRTTGSGTVPVYRPPASVPSLPPCPSHSASTLSPAGEGSRHGHSYRPR
jgi:hypothetical protein